MILKINKVLHCCVMVGFYLGCSMPAQCDTNTLTDLLKKTHGEAPTVSQVGAIFLARTNAPNQAVLNNVVRACGAGLIYLKKTDAYSDKVRPLIPNCADFEKSLQDSCKACGGTGYVSVECKKCNGTGKCTSPRCRGGESSLPGFDGRVETRQCSVCKGTGNCLNCKGERSIQMACRACAGKGQCVDADTVLAVYRGEIDQALRLVTSGAMANQAQSREIGIATNGAIANQAEPRQISNKLDSQGNDVFRKRDDYLRKMAEEKAIQKQRDERTNADVRRIEIERAAAYKDIVSTAIMQAAKQISTSKLLGRYLCTSNDFAYISPDLTSVQRNEAFVNTYKRSLPSIHIENRGYLFFPIPAGLHYVVSDVREVNGKLIMDLSRLEELDDVYRSLSKNFGEFFDYQFMRVVIPRSDGGERLFNKRQHVITGEWIGRVIVARNDNIYKRGIRADRYVFMSENDIDDLTY